MKACVTAVIIAIATNLLLFAGGLLLWFDEDSLSHRLKIEAARHFINAEFRPFLMRPDYSARLWENNECMILYMLVAADYASPVKEAISPLVPAASPDSCVGLDALLNGAQVPAAYYHRYLHGYRLATAALLTVLPAHAIPFVLDVGVHVLVLALLVAGIQRARSRERRQEGIGYAIMAAGLLLFWGLARFGASISFVFGDAAVVGCVAWFFWRHPLRMREGQFQVVCAMAGAAVACFEFMTGQIPLALAVIPVCLVIASLSEPDRRLLLRRAVIGPSTFLLTAALCFVIKYAAAAAVFGPDVLTNVLDQGSRLSVGAIDLDLPPAALHLLASLGLPTTYTGGLLNTAYWLGASLALATPAIGLGSFFLGAAVLALSGLVIVAGLALGLRGRVAAIDRARACVLLASLGYLAAWYVVFHRHATIHAGFMVRPLAMLPIVAGVTVLCRTCAVACSAPAPPVT